HRHPILRPGPVGVDEQERALAPVTVDERSRLLKRDVDAVGDDVWAVVAALGEGRAASRTRPRTAGLLRGEAVNGATGGAQVTVAEPVHERIPADLQVEHPVDRLLQLG